MLNYEITQEQYYAVMKRDGIMEERKRLILSIHRKGKDIKEIADFLDVSEEEVQKTIKEELENSTEGDKMLNYEITQEQWIRIHKRDGKAEVAVKMLKRGRPLSEILYYTELEEKTVRELAASNNIEIKE